MAQQTPPPDFVIAGVAKCGSTALYEYFREHPQVFMTALKEPHFFAADLLSPRYIKDKSRYLKLFEKAPEGAVRGEASVHYINSQCAVDRLLSHNPAVKIIILLRNPLDLLRSWHDNMLYNGAEEIKNLEEAWHAQYERAKGRNIPTPMLGREWKLQYREFCCIGQLAARIAQQVPREQLQFMLLDDLIEDQESFHRQATEFLGVDYFEMASRESVNPAKRSRFVWLTRFLVWGKFVNNRYVQSMAPWFDRIGFHPLRMLRIANTLSHTPEKPSEEFRQELYRFFKAEIDTLERLLDRSLDHWRSI